MNNCHVLRAGAGAAAVVAVAQVTVARLGGAKAYGEIWIGAEDDYYGIEAYSFGLVTNNIDEIHKLPGELSLDGYQLATEPLYFVGQSAFPVAASSDGAVEIGCTCTFDEVEVY